MISRFFKCAFSVGFLFFVASCGVYFVDGELRNLSVRYSEPDISRENGELFRIGDDYWQSFATANVSLRNAGFSIISSNARTGQIQVTSTQNAAINCGQMAVGKTSALRVFDANVAKAAIEIPVSGGSSFALREVAVATTATIMIGVDSSQNNAVFASVLENHIVNLSLQDVTDLSSLYDQSLEFSGNATGRFQRGLICGSARYIRSVLSAG